MRGFMQFIGTIMLIGGLALSTYFFAAYKITVKSEQAQIMGQTVGGEQVNNMGLISNRESGILYGMGLAFLGAFALYSTRGWTVEPPAPGSVYPYTQVEGQE